MQRNEFLWVRLTLSNLKIICCSAVRYLKDLVFIEQRQDMTSS